jgi:MFS family permease
MSEASRRFRRLPFLRFERSAAVPLSPTQALAAAFHDTVQLLAKPVDAKRWLKLSVLCLFLGGGTPSAAFNWTLGSLPGDIGLHGVMGRVRTAVSEHIWLIALAAVVGLGLLLGVLYLRSVFRFVLVDAILTREVRVRQGLRSTRRTARSYFCWLLGAITVISGALVGGGALAYPYLRSPLVGEMRSFAFWIMLVAVLAVEVLIGLAMAMIIVLTDDFVVPMMYAEDVPLLPAWRKLQDKLRAEPGPFAAYVLLRFCLAVATSVATLFLLFPTLLGLFSTAIVAGALALLSLHVLGFAWSWNPVTVLIASAALAMLVSLVLVILSVVGMPAQVLIQSFGIRFIASRCRSVEVVLPPLSSVLGAEGAPDATRSSAR